MLQCVLGTSFISTTLAFIYLKKKKEKVLLGFTFLLWLEVVITLLL